MNKDRYTFEDLLEIMKLLRSEDGCPWDREQTHESLKKYLLEETYEVFEEIDSKDTEKLCEELGDVLLQVVFHGQIGKEEGSFDINDIITAVCKKMVSRHTHVFGRDIAKTSDDVIDNWEKQKRKEKSIESHTQGLKSISRALPALMKSYKVQEKAAKIGFDFTNINDAFKKVDEEIAELKSACVKDDFEHIEEELGDALFALVNVSRFVKVQPELALDKTVEKFIKRFEYIEQSVLQSGKKLEETSLEEMDLLWERAKNV